MKIEPDEESGSIFIYRKPGHFRRTPFAFKRPPLAFFD
jgi:hypothetical protein